MDVFVPPFPRVEARMMIVSNTAGPLMVEDASKVILFGLTLSKVPISKDSSPDKPTTPNCWTAIV